MGATIGYAARQAPVLLIVEDLHWADGATLGMLAHALRMLGQAPVLVAGSLRDEDAEGQPALHPLLDDLRRERRLERVTLAGLSEAETGALAGTWLGAPASPELAEAIQRRTGGNPFFVEELVRHLVESEPGRPAEALVEAAGVEVPEGVRALIDRRLARLPEPAAQAVRLAAVAGEDFALADLAAAGELSDEALADGLDAAVAAGLVDEAAAPGDYRFAHALVRQAVIAGLTGTRRALLHRRLAEALEALPGDRRLAERARHLLNARPLVDAGIAAACALRAAAAGDADARLRGRRRPARACRRERPRRERSASHGGAAGPGRRPSAPGRRARPLGSASTRRRGWRARSGTTSCWPARRSARRG